MAEESDSAEASKRQRLDAAPAAEDTATPNQVVGPALPINELEEEEGDGAAEEELPEDGALLADDMYGENTPKAGGAARFRSNVPKGAWIHIKRRKCMVAYMYI